jgi:phage terminase small subunit
MLRPVHTQIEAVAAGNATAEILCTPQESIFATHYAESRNHYAALRAAYPDLCNGKSNPTIYRAACNILSRPHVLHAIEEVRAMMNAQTLVRATDIMRDLVDIVDANPNELVSVEKYNCRYCHGIDYGMQWVDAAELALALDAWMSRKKKTGSPPSASGGFGFQHKGEPARDCPHCLGDGIEKRIVHDTTRLSPQARKLLKSVEQNADGSVRIVMHDQMLARDMLIKMLGAYKDPKQVAPPAPPGSLESIDKDATPEDAQRAYLSLIKT